MAACCPTSSSSSSSSAIDEREEAIQHRLDQMRRERLSEVKSIGRLAEDSAFGTSGPQAALRRLLERQQQTPQPAATAAGASASPPAPGISAEILVEVRGLSELRPVSRVLQSSSFRTELESLVRYSLTPRQSRPESRRQQPQQSQQQQQQQLPTSERPEQQQQLQGNESLTQLNQRRHEELVQEISELLHTQLVTGGLDGPFRARLDRQLRQRAEALPDGGRRAEAALQRLPPSSIQRNDFSHLGIFVGAAGGDDLNSASDDLLSVVSVPISGGDAAAAAATATVTAYATSAAVSRQLHSVQRELIDLRRTVRLLLGNQLETQRMIRQEVSAALAGRAAPPAPQGTSAPPGACLICLSGRADTVMYRCGHLCLCSMCTARMRESSADGSIACPVCRAPVVDTLRVFSAGVAPDARDA